MMSMATGTSARVDRNGADRRVAGADRHETQSGWQRVVDRTRVAYRAVRSGIREVASRRDVTVPYSWPHRRGAADAIGETAVAERAPTVDEGAVWHVVREQLDAHTEQLRTLTEAVAAFTKILEAHDDALRVVHALDEHLEALQRDNDRERSEIANSLNQLAQAITALPKRIDTERADDQGRSNGERILGGTMYASDDDRFFGEPNTEPLEGLSVNEAVSCRFGEQWIEGMQIVEVINDTEPTTYRLRRAIDGYAPPVTFRARDLRRDPAQQTTPNRSARWSRS
jgi:hypothetical protein